jgi:hypothetical protein
MKHPNRPIRAAAMLFGALATAVHADPPVMRDAATHEQLSLALRKADQVDPMKSLPTTKGEDPSLSNRPKDILSDSDIISFRGTATLVPKRAIIQIPKNHADLIKMEPGAKIVSWSEFFAANRGWITTIEVSRVQAEGNQPLAEETLKFMGTCRNLIVATYQGGPISVLPLKEPAAETPGETPAETTPQTPKS